MAWRFELMEKLAEWVDYKGVYYRVGPGYFVKDGERSGVVFGIEQHKAIGVFHTIIPARFVRLLMASADSFLKAYDRGSYHDGGVGTDRSSFRVGSDRDGRLSEDV